MDFSDAKIAVYNEGPVEPELFYNGQGYRYPVGKAVVVPYEIAYFHFAIELRGGKLVRQKTDNDDRSQSWYNNRLSTYLPYGLKHPRAGDPEDEKKANLAKFKEFEEWFANGLSFKLVKSSSALTQDEFAKLK